MSVLRGLVEPFGYGPAYPDWLAVTTPAAGATASLTLEGRWSIRILGARLSITTDANVADRFVSIDYLDGRDRTFYRNGAGLVVTASTTAAEFEFQANRTVGEWAANTPIFAPIAPWFMPTGFKVKFNVVNIQATDAISGLALWVERFGTQDDEFPIGMVAAPAGG